MGNYDDIINIKMRFLEEYLDNIDDNDDEMNPFDFIEDFQSLISNEIKETIELSIKEFIKTDIKETIKL